METLRCPTCLALLLDGGEKRCPACNARLRTRRRQPIVLGESARITSRNPLALDRKISARATAQYQPEQLRGPQPAPAPATMIDLTLPEPTDAAPITERMPESALHRAPTSPD